MKYVFVLFILFVSISSRSFAIDQFTLVKVNEVFQQMNKTLISFNSPRGIIHNSDNVSIFGKYLSICSELNSEAQSRMLNILLFAKVHSMPLTLYTSEEENTEVCMYALKTSN